MIFKTRMTLVELLVVLLLLAVTSTLVLGSIVNHIDQVRFDQTRLLLESIRRVSLGTEPEYSEGYVVEMGEPPQRLEDLWINPDALNRVFGKKIASDASGVELYCGWRGPYLQLPISQTVLLDGWGNPLELLDQNGLPPLPGRSFEIVRSLGSDAQNGGSGAYTQDLAAVFAATSVAVAGTDGVTVVEDLYRAQIDVFIRFEDSGGLIGDPLGINGSLTIRYYHPAPVSGEVVFEQIVIPTPFVLGEDFRRSFNATIGRRALHAFQDNGATILTSEITYLTVRRGNQVMEIQIIIKL